jgi:hypothetical protein
MKLLIAGLVVVAGLAVYAAARARSGPMPEAAYRVMYDDTRITVTAPDGEARTVAWSALTKVGIRTTDDGPLEADVFWGLHAGSGEPAVVFPGGATGEQDLLREFGVRLPGFRHEEVIRAMGSTSNAFFVAWESAATERTP